MHIRVKKKIHRILRGKENAGDLTIEEVNDVEKFRSLRESWNTLLQESPDNNIFLTWEWLFIWWQHYGGNKKLRIFLIKDADKIIGIAPFMQSKYRKGFISVNVLENICGENCDYSGIILTQKKDNSITILWDYLEKNITNDKIIVRMWHIPENSNFLTVLCEQYPSFSDSLFLSMRVVSSCPYIELPATREDYYQTLHRNGRKKIYKLQREMQKLQQNHKVEFKKYAGGNDLREQLQALFELHQKRWQEQNISSKFTALEAREFYADVSEAFYQNNWLDLSFLAIDGEPVSAGWAFIYGNGFYYMTSAFDPSYSDYNVSHMHTIHLIEEAIQNGLSTFDFLKGDEFHKAYYTHSATDNVQITMTKSCFSGRCRVKLLEILPKIHMIGLRSLRHRYLMYVERRQRKENKCVNTEDR